MLGQKNTQKLAEIFCGLAFIFIFSVASANVMAQAQAPEAIAPTTALDPNAAAPAVAPAQPVPQPVAQPAPVAAAPEPITPQANVEAPAPAAEVPAPAPAPVAEAPKPQRPAWQLDHDRAVRMARDGNTKDALNILRPLYQSHGNDKGIVRDYLAVLSWDGGHEQQVVSLYNQLPGEQPNYVLEAVGKAYRDLRQPDEARKVYLQGLRAKPSSDVYAAGLIHSTTEAGYAEDALKEADSNISSYGPRLEVLLAAANAADQYGQGDAAVRYYKQAVNVAPRNTQALEGLVRAMSRSGKPEEAIDVADQHPGLISAEEYRRIKSDIAANMIRDGFEAPTEAQRYTVTDRALVMLNGHIQEWSRLGVDAQQDVVRARLDRVLALRNRNLMQEVVVQYNKLIEDGITVPPYVLSSVGDAYMYLHQPEKARDVFLQVLKSDPQNYNVRRQLVYAYTECDEYSKAYEVADSLAADQPYWIHVDGAKSPVVNPKRMSAELLAGSARSYAGEIDKAYVRILPITAAAPNMVATREVLGNIYQIKGWNRQAVEQFRAATALNGGQNIGAEAGEAGSLLQLQRFKEAEAKTNDLVKRAPESLAVQRAARDQEIYNMAELRVRAGYDFEPMSSQIVTGGEAYGIDTMLYSPPINYNWRIFAGQFYAHQNQPNNEGSVGFSRTAVGAEYRGGPLTASISPTYNRYNDGDRIGVAGDATYWLNDQWAVAASGEKLSRETPRRALNQGITSDFFSGRVTYRADNTREIRVGGVVQPFSDDNTRTGIDASYKETVFTYPDLRIDGLVDAGESQSSGDANRPYYNPKQDAAGLVGARGTHTIYQRYSTLWQQSLTLLPGAYWQENFGTSAMFRARYEQRLFLNNTFETGFGVNYMRKSFDGNPQNDVSLTLDLTDRF